MGSFVASNQKTETMAPGMRHLLFGMVATMIGAASSGRSFAANAASPLKIVQLAIDLDNASIRDMAVRGPNKPDDPFNPVTDRVFTKAFLHDYQRAMKVDGIAYDGDILIGDQMVKKLSLLSAKTALADNVTVVGAEIDHVGDDGRHIRGEVDFYVIEDDQDWKIDNIVNAATIDGKRQKSLRDRFRESISANP